MQIDRARADLAKAEGDVKRLQAQLEDARARATKLAHFIEMAELYDRGVEPSTSRGTGGRSAEAARLAVEILKERGRPLHTRELLTELEQRGLVIHSANPVTNLSASLSRSPELKANRSHGWSLSQWQSESRDDSDSIIWGPDSEPE